ncbi:MAG: hypothetical protein K2K21_14785 [Lachnospiraceae bacterium]|nr:hypothetical protein [Lachnospiraceae bacterium]
MNERLKRYIVRCKILILMPLMAALTGCGKDAYTDSFEGMESVENVENLEHVESEEVNINSDEVNIKHDAVDITHNEDETQESEDVNYSVNIEAANEVDIDPMEIYERFLNGRLSIELEEKQVTISNLFWDNDIKYCFLDIDSDGIDELHIKDNVIYYAIKAVDGAPKILFEGRWCYEPVATDELCGILYDANWGYGYEHIEFIQISPDGSTEIDGEFGWSDENENGIMDAEDSFRIDIGYDASLEKYIGYEYIDMERYVQYKKEHSAQQAGYELEWTEKRLKEFATWQEAYIDFLKKPSATIWVSGRDSEDYSLIYVDDDDTPELYFYTGGAVYGETIVSFHEGKVRSMNRDRGGIKYIEYGGLLYSDWGNMGFYPCNIYMLEKGEFSEIGTGWISDHYDEETAIVYYTYYWEGKEMTETEYEECIKEKIDKSKCIEPSVLYSRDEMLEILK